MRNFAACGQYSSIVSFYPWEPGSRQSVDFTWRYHCFSDFWDNTGMYSLDLWTSCRAALHMHTFGFYLILVSL